MTSNEQDGQDIVLESTSPVDKEEMNDLLKPQASIEQAVADRAAKRAAKSAERESEGTRLKEEGNKLFKERDYQGAASLYQEAIDVHGNKAVYLSNLAAALLKLECFDEAADAADEALIMDPSFLKARYRRGVARKEQNLLKAAITDFETILQADPTSVSVKEELSIVRDLWESGEGDETGFNTSEDDWPHIGDPKWEESSMSDSSDCRHTGNGIPCRFYNHDGCAKGMACAFSHAPDSKSVRDNLGRNVCLYFLLDKCKFGDVKCIYSHSRKYLPQTGGWTDENELKARKEAFEDAEQSKRDQRELDDLLWKLQNGVGLGDERRSGQRSGGKSKGKGRQAVNGNGSSDKRKPAATGSRKGKVGAAKDADATDGIFTDYKVNQRATTSQSIRGRDDDGMPTALMISLYSEEWFSEMYADLLAALHAKFRLSTATNASSALSHLASPSLSAVFVADAGIVQRKNQRVLDKLVEFARNGGSVVIGGQFSNHVTGNDVERFFRDAWGLPWKMGDYHRTTFVLNPGRSDRLKSTNDINVSRSMLAPSYSMKAVHLRDVSPDVVVYKSEDGARLQSHVFAPVSIEDRGQAPVVYTKVGKGWLGYIGDVNTEEGSTTAVLAMMGT